MGGPTLHLGAGNRYTCLRWMAVLVLAWLAGLPTRGS